MIVSSASPDVRIVSAKSRCSSLSGVSMSRPLMPMTALSGVRISWLMAARNELFASFACSAAWRASCASSNRRAFSTATPMLAATVASSRASASVNRFSWVVPWTLMAPMARSPARIGTPRNERARVPTIGDSSISSSVSQEDRLPVLDDLGGQALAEGERLLRLVRSPLDVVREVDGGSFRRPGAR